MVVSGATPFTTLLTQARDGDGDAFAQLWRRYAPGVAAFARARGAREPDEVTSDAFVAAFRQVATFVGDENAFKALLFTIARRRVVDDIRRSRRRREVDDAGAPVVTVASAEDVVLSAVDGDALHELLRDLTADQREVLVLRVFGDLPIEQVAAITHRRPGAVKALQHRALATLRRNLERRPSTLSSLLGEE